MKKAILGGLVLGLLAFGGLVLPQASRAFEADTGPTVNLAESETVEGNFYAAGTTINIQGTVNGDVVAAGQTITVTGRVNGDILAAANTIVVSGQVDGNIRLAAGNSTLTGSTSRNVMAFGSSVTLGKQAKIGGSMLFMGDTADIAGKVDGILHGSGRKAVISGNIGGIDLSFGKVPEDQNQGLIIEDGAVVRGDIKYSAPQSGSISENVDIQGEVTYSELRNYSRGFSSWNAWYGLFSLFSMLVAGLILVSLWRDPMRQLTDYMLEKTTRSIIFGLLVMFVTPLLCLVLIFTLIGVPVAIIILALWLIALYLAKIMAGILIGRALVEKMWQAKKDSLIWSMITGVTIVWFITTLPVVGFITSLIFIWWGLGAIWYMLEISTSSK
jgi:cytoskeletal protein CcmA (bactofilin family)